MSTIAEWIAQAPESVRDQFECIAGRWKEREVAGWDHQEYGRLLANEFGRRGLRANGGVRIYLPVPNGDGGPEHDGPDWVVPDVFVVARANPVQPGPASYAGVPDLVVEILAADNDAGEDLIKKARYAHAGVPHYWLVRLHGTRVEASALGAGGEYQPAWTAPLLPLDALLVPDDLA